MIPTQIVVRKEVGNEGNTKEKNIFKVRIKYKARGKDVYQHCTVTYSALNPLSSKRNPLRSLTYLCVNL